MLVYPWSRDILEIILKDFVTYWCGRCGLIDRLQQSKSIRKIKQPSKNVYESSVDRIMFYNYLMSSCVQFTIATTRGFSLGVKPYFSSGEYRPRRFTPAVIVE